MQSAYATFRLFLTDSSQSAKVSSVDSLLDLVNGKPAVKEEKEIVDLPPVVIELTGPS
jgi:hypothetical protein